MGRSGIFLTQAAPKQSSQTDFCTQALHYNHSSCCKTSATAEGDVLRRHQADTAGREAVLEGRDLCLSLKPKWHSEFQNIKGIQIKSFTSNKTVVKLSLLLILPAAVRF